MSVIYNTTGPSHANDSGMVNGYGSNTEELLCATTSTPAIVCAVTVPSPCTIETIKRTLTTADHRYGFVEFLDNLNIFHNLVN